MKPLQIASNVPLSRYSTMRLGGQAAHAVGVTSRSEVAAAHAWAAARGLPCLMVGSGSNIVWRDEDFPGLLIVNRITGYQTDQQPDGSVLLTLGAGENWDQMVARSVAAGLTGIECLSYVPGTAGATPVQNVGAYGQEIAHTLANVEAYDTQTRQFVRIPASECAFGYRTSRFKTTDRGRYYIVSITLKLTQGHLMPPFYPALQKYLDEQQITDYSSQSIRNAVIAVRSAKLPDPNVVANNGSFFANPVVEQAAYLQIAGQYPDTTVPNWPTTDGRVKLSAAWLMDQAGFKDFHDSATGMATWPKQSLVLINENATSAADLLTFKQKIVDAVQAKFGIVLEQEPELLP